jgi:hypothetical protein
MSHKGYLSFAPLKPVHRGDLRARPPCSTSTHSIMTRKSCRSGQVIRSGFWGTALKAKVTVGKIVRRAREAGPISLAVLSDSGSTATRTATIMHARPTAAATTALCTAAPVAAAVGAPFASVPLFTSLCECFLNQLHLTLVRRENGQRDCACCCCSRCCCCCCCWRCSSSFCCFRCDICCRMSSWFGR